MEDRIENIGENYEWCEKSAEIVHKTTGCRRHDSDYSAKVDVYEDRVKGWFLDVVTPYVIPESSPGDYLAVMVALSYIEGVEQYRKGEDSKSSSCRCFKVSSCRIFPEASEEAIDRLWRDVRNGMFHDGFTKGPTLLSHDGRLAICIENKYLRINPMLLLKGVIDDFKQYIAQLRETPDSSLARNFSNHWDTHWKNT